MMSKKDKALKWASELLRNIYRGDVYEVKMLIDVANACKEALGENCQECEALKHDLDGYMQANKEMLNKEWQSITDDELLSACEDCDRGFNISGFQQGALWADKVLKEKNNGTT